MVVVHLVDGTFELFRCFHGSPRATGPAGAEVGAARALFATLTALLEHRHVTHAAVAFDSIVAPARPSGPPTPADLIGAQQPLAARVVRALGVPVWPAGRFQADDVLASGAALLAADPHVEQVVICTTDHDLTQCVRGTRVVLLDRIRDVVTDEEGVVTRFGVPPTAIPDLFALVGDRSDGLAGVPGWGKASAAAVLHRYGRVEHIPDDPDQWDVRVRGAARLAASLREHRSEVLLTRELAIRRDDLPIPVELDGLAWHGARRDLVAALTAELDDDSVTGRITHWAS